MAKNLRGYLLPRFLKKYPYRKALLLHGLVTLIWHLLDLVIMRFNAGDTPIVPVLMILVVNFVPTIMHTLVFAYIWNRTGSLAVVTAYHFFFDEIRDTLENSVSSGGLGQNWQMVVLIVLGMLVLWKTKWKTIQSP